MAASSIEDCFYSVITARKIAESFHIPVVLLSDASLATAQQPFPRPEFSEDWLAPPVDQTPAAPGARPYDWDPVTGIATRLVPGRPGGMHTVTGLAHDRDSHVAYDSGSNEDGLRHRSLKLVALQKTLKTTEVFGDPDGDLLIVGWGSTKGAIEEAVDRLRDEGLRVSSLHLRFLQPLPPGVKAIMERFDRVLTVEAAWSDRWEDELVDDENRRYSPLATVLRSRYLVDIDCWSEARGQPIKPATVCNVVRERRERMERVWPPSQAMPSSDDGRPPLPRGLRGGRPALVQRLRRQRHPGGRAAALPRRGPEPGAHGVRIRHRLLEPVPALHGDVRLPRNPWARVPDRGGDQDGAPRPRCVRQHRRRRLLQHRRGALDPRRSATT